jgi:Tol biopolymer transport system component
MRIKPLPALLLLACLAASAPGAAMHSATPPVLLERASRAADPAEQPNQWSHAPALSGDGRLVVFLSEASNLVAGDTNGLLDVFVYDRDTGLVELVSIGHDGSPANGEPSRPSISPDGRYVAFNSTASNLVPDDTNAHQDVFLFDRKVGLTERISLTSDEAQIDQDAFTKRPAISVDGRFVVFYSNAQALSPDAAADTYNIYLRDRQEAETLLLTRGYDAAPANGDSVYPTISADGNWVAYYSFASNLVVSDTNHASDVFLYSRLSQETWRVSVDSSGAQGNNLSDLAAISADGRYVAFYSSASNLVPGDTNRAPDIFVHDHASGATELASRAWDGGWSNGESDVPSISADGRYVAFYSYASNLVPQDTNGFTDVYRYDRQLGSIARASLGEWLQQGSEDSMCSAISEDGQVVAFYSFAENLVEGDSNAFTDVFVRDFNRAVDLRYVILPLLHRQVYP